MDLQKHYHLLSKQERLTLFLRAVGRDDQAEVEAVKAATPYRAMQMGDFYPELDALQTMTLLHLMWQLDTLLSVVVLLYGNKTPVEFQAARHLARRFLVTEEAWREF